MGSGNPHPVCKFKKGNPGGGRPKGSFSFKTVIKRISELPADIADDVGDEPKTRGLKAVLAIQKKAEEGDVAAFKVISERMEGMPKQETDLTLKRGRFDEFESMSDEEILAKVKEMTQ